VSLELSSAGRTFVFSVFHINLRFQLEVHLRQTTFRNAPHIMHARSITTLLSVILFIPAIALAAPVSSVVTSTASSNPGGPTDAAGERTPSGRSNHCAHAMARPACGAACLAQIKKDISLYSGNCVVIERGFALCAGTCGADLEGNPSLYAPLLAQVQCNATDASVSWLGRGERGC
jgi:hypothetical protein